MGNWAMLGPQRVPSFVHWGRERWGPMHRSAVSQAGDQGLGTRGEGRWSPVHGGSVAGSPGCCRGPQLHALGPVNLRIPSCVRGLRGWTAVPVLALGGAGCMLGCCLSRGGGGRGGGIPVNGHGAGFLGPRLHA